MNVKTHLRLGVKRMHPEDISTSPQRETRLYLRPRWSVMHGIVLWCLHSKYYSIHLFQQY